MENETIKRSVHILLAILIIIQLVTGLGIVYYQIIGSLTLGLISKDLAFQIHIINFVPLLIVLVLHSFMPWFLEE